MKSLIIVSFAVCALAACSSKTTKAETPTQHPEASASTPATPAATAEKAPTPAKDKKIHTAGKGKAAAPVAAKEEKPEAKAVETTAAAAPGKQTCTSGSDTRVVELKQAGSGCELVYTKAGEAKTIATAKNEKNYCEGISEKIMKKLQDSGFSCK